MEEVNPWLDPGMGAHTNKKSVKPEKVDPKKVETKNVNPENIDPKTVESVNKRSPKEKDKIDQYLETLVSVALNSELPDSCKDWAVQKFGKEWIDQFSEDLKTLGDELLTSHYYPAEPTMILLKLAFLLRQ